MKTRGYLSLILTLAELSPAFAADLTTRDGQTCPDIRKMIGFIMVWGAFSSPPSLCCGAAIAGWLISYCSTSPLPLSPIKSWWSWQIDGSKPAFGHQFYL